MEQQSNESLQGVALVDARNVDAAHGFDAPRRDVLRRAAYVAPALVGLGVVGNFANAQVQSCDPNGPIGEICPPDPPISP